MKVFTHWRILHTKKHGYPYLFGTIDGKTVSTTPIIEVLGNGMCRTRNTTYQLTHHTNELDLLDKSSFEQEGES